MKTQRYTPDQVAEALRRAHGIKTVAAASLRCSRRTVSRYIARYPRVREVYDQAREEFVDEAEVQLMDLVDDGKWPAVKFTLVTLGKDRGYTTGDAIRREVESDEAAKDYEATLLKVYGPRTGTSRQPAESPPQQDDDLRTPGDPTEGQPQSSIENHLDPRLLREGRKSKIQNV